MPHINSFCQTLLALLLTLCALAPAYAATDIEDNEYVVFYHHDVLGSPKAATDEKGRIIWREHGTPYGRTLGRTGSGGEPFNDTSSESGDNRPGYTGHTLDTGSGLIYMKGRYYDPSIGRFLSNDPVGTDPSQPASFNRYAYANNNPYVFVDPDGEFPLAVLATPPAQVALAAAGKYTITALTGIAIGVGLFESSVKPALSTKADDEQPDQGDDEGGSGPGSANTSGLDKQIERHQEKLEQYKSDPGRYDNKGFLTDASPELREKIIDSRIRSLEKQIDNFRSQKERAEKERQEKEESGRDENGNS